MRYIVTNASGKDIIGGMTGDGRGVRFDELPTPAQEAVKNGSYQYSKRTAVTSQFIEVEMDYFVRKDGGK